MPVCVLHHISLASPPYWESFFSVYDSITSSQGLRVYMSLTSHNPGTEACLPVCESQIISEQDGSLRKIGTEIFVKVTLFCCFLPPTA